MTSGPVGFRFEALPISLDHFGLNSWAQVTARLAWIEAGKRKKPRRNTDD